MLAMNAIQTTERAFSNEAWSHIDRHDLPRESFKDVRLMLIQQAYQREIEPFCRELTRLHGLCIPALIFVDGKLDRSELNVPAELKDVEAFHLARIEDIKARYTEMTKS